MRINFLETTGMNYSEDYVRDFIEFCAVRLFGDNDYDNLHLDFSMREVDDRGFTGETVTYDFDDTDHPEFIDIHVMSGLSNDEFLTTVAHEMVHVKQLALGELLVDENTLGLSWYRMSECINGEYHETPWEVEALRLEKELLELWKREFHK